MKTVLEVPFGDKDRAKALGARFDMSIKQWYVPDGIDIWPFKRWLPGSVSSWMTKHENFNSQAKKGKRQKHGRAAR